MPATKKMTKRRKLMMKRADPSMVFNHSHLPHLSTRGNEETKMVISEMIRQRKKRTRGHRSTTDNFPLPCTWMLAGEKEGGKGLK